MYLLLLLTIITPIFGQLLRFEVMTGAAILAHELIMAMLLLWYGYWKIGIQRKWRLGYFGGSIILIWVIMIIGLLLGFGRLASKEIIVSSLYFFRFIAYSSLYFISKDVFRNTKQQTTALKALTISLCLTCLFGFVQLWLFPDFEALKLHQIGWDPHIGRLTSTWLDPNYYGGYASFGILMLMSTLMFFIKEKKKKAIVISSLILGILLLSVMLTYSRSSYLALFCGLFVLGILRYRKLVIVAAIGSILLFSSSQRLQERVYDAYLSFKALFTDSTYDLDPTAELRILSWKRGFSLFSEYPTFGVGYNTLRFEKERHGFTRVDHHAASGFDSSLLTILVTTGIAGFLAFLLFFTKVISFFWKQAKYAMEPMSNLCIGFLAVIASLFIHSFFVNTFFFPFFMVFFWICLGLLEQMSQKITKK